MSLLARVLTVSDGVVEGSRDDRSGQALADRLTEAGFDVDRRLVVADGVESVAAGLRELCAGFSGLVVTTGGTGPALRDVTVEATLAVGHKSLPGFGEQMRAVSLLKVPTAILSRQEATVRFRNDGSGCLIVNLPGSIKAIRECLLAVMPAIPYCIDLIGGPALSTRDDVVKAFRPKKSAELK